MTLSRADSVVPQGHGSTGSGGTDAEQGPHTATVGATVFADPQSRSLAKLIERIASTEVPVLIAGETGTGKEHLARHIHERSGRSGEFLALQCGQLTDTGAPHSWPTAQTEPRTIARFGGGFRSAWDGGTVLFDDVADLSLSLQCELLRILRDSETTSKQRDGVARVRIIASTSTDLGEATVRGRFRRDLLYRLNLVSVKVLPLRQRPGDIVPLAHHFLRLHSENGRLPARVLGHDATAALRQYQWPGNVRELQNVIRFALLTVSRREISAQDLRLPHEQASWQPAAGDGSQEMIESTQDRLAGILALLLQSPGSHLFDDVEGTLVREAFRAAGENQVHTATLLGISRNVVRTLLQKQGLLKPRRRVRP